MPVFVPWIANALSLIPLLIAPMYTRMRAEEALGHTTRQRIFGILRDRPGTSRRELSQMMQVSGAALLHHLEIMGACGLIAARRAGREIIYTCGPRPPIEASLRTPARLELARLLLVSPRTQVELSSETGLSQRLVAYHLARMEDIVEATCERPRRYLVREPQHVEAALARAGSAAAVRS